MDFLFYIVDYRQYDNKWIVECSIRWNDRWYNYDIQYCFFSRDSFEAHPFGAKLPFAVVVLLCVPT